MMTEGLQRIVVVSKELLRCPIITFTGIVVGDLGEHCDEFFEVDQSVAVGVDLGDDFCPECISHLDVLAEDAGELIDVDSPVSIFVVEAERLSHVLLVEERVMVDRRRAPLVEIDGTSAFSVSVFEELFSALISGFIWVTGEGLHETIDELVERDETIAVFVPQLERPLQSSLLLLGRLETRHERQRSFLELGLVLRKLSRQGFVKIITLANQNRQVVLPAPHDLL